MSTATAEQVQTTFQMIELAKITPSPMNPRKHFDEQALKDLAASIKSHGVQQPIVVRPDGNKKEKYEIVVGERRFRASKIAGQENIPAIIRPLSNAAALEIMVIENLQREDVHPLDEALGYEALMKKSPDEDVEFGPLPGTPKHTAESIAAKVGKSVGYVYARLKLLALVPAAREAFQGDYITAGHAVLIARLQPKDQISAIDACFTGQQTKYRDDELKKLDPHAAKFTEVVEFDESGAEGFRRAIHPRLLSEKGLRDWIQENVNLKLKGVPWDLDDEQLVPWAGPCSICPKRSMSNPALFAELTKKGEDDTCFDPQCFHDKQKAFVKLQVKTEKASGQLVQISEQAAYTKPKEGEKVMKQGHWLPAKVGECESVQKALIVRGDNAGEHKIVCTDVNCKVHKRHLMSSSSESRASVSPEKRAAEEAKQKQAEERNRKFKLLMLERISEKLTPRQVLGLIFEQYMDEQGAYLLKGFLEYRGWKGDTEKVLRDMTETLRMEEAWTLLAQMLLWEDVSDSYEELGRHLPVMAKSCKVDIKKLSAEFDKSQTPAKSEKPAKAAKPAAKKGKKAKKAKAK